MGKFVVWLEHNLLRMYLRDQPAFLWQTQIQKIEYGLNDTIRMKKKEVTLYPFTPSDMSFWTIWMPDQSEFGKNFVTKTGPLEPSLS